jgi:hypothetical protein
MAVERIQERDTIAKSSVNWTHYLKGLSSLSAASLDLLDISYSLL